MTGGDLRVDTWLRDARYGFRSLWRSAGFTVVAVLTLALGIGASTAMFSALRGVVFRRLPVRDQDAIAVLWLQAATGGVDHWPIEYRDLTAFREATHAFESVAGVNFQGASELVMLDAGRPVTLDGSWVTGNFFSVLGLSPARGRLLRPSDDVPGAAPVMVIGYAFWQRQFGGDASVIGHALEWNGRSYTVVGVLPRDFEYPKRTQAWFAVLPWFPGTVDISALSPAIQFDLVGRLRPGTSLRGARDDFQSFLRATDSARSASERGGTPVVTSLPALVIGNMRSMLWAGCAAVGLLLLIACINVANLLLIRASARANEIAIRVALGAGRHRLVRQLLIESGVLGVAGGALGILIAAATIRAVVALAPPELPRRDVIAIDPAVLVFAIVVTALAVLLAGLAPAILAVADDVGVSLRAGRGALGGSRRTQRLRHGLVVGQISLAFLVAIAGGLLARSLIALTGVNMGFNPDRLLVVETSIPPQLVAQRSEGVALQEAALARVSASPGVIAATMMPKPPFSAQGGWFGMITGEGQSAEAQKSNPLVNFEVVSPGYFHTMGIPVLRGRAFGEQDREHALPVAIVSDALVRHLWPGQDPIGKRVKNGSPEDTTDWLTVVGVVGETRYHELTRLEPSLYVPVRQTDAPMPMTLAVRTRADPEGVVPEIRRALQEVNPAWVIAGGGSMRQLLAAPLARPRFSALLFVTFAAITVLLAIVGIYGALAATVSQRSRGDGDSPGPRRRTR